MALETLAPDTIESSTNLSGVVGDIQDDPASPDTNYLSAPDIDADTAINLSFPDASGSLTTGTDVQQFRIRVGGTQASGSRTPDALKFDLYEGATFRTELYNVNNPSIPATGDGTGGVVISLPWNAADLSSQAANTDVRLVMTCTADAHPPSAETTCEVLSCAWDVEYEQFGQTYERTLSDSMDMADQQDRISNALRHLINNFAFDDFVMKAKERGILTTDNFAIDDGELKRFQKFNYRGVDEIEFTDTVSQEIIGITVFFRTLVDSFAFADSVKINQLLSRLLDDSFAFNDFIHAFVENNRALIDSFNLTDSISVAKFAATMLRDYMLMDDGSATIERKITQFNTDNFDLTDQTKTLGLFIRALFNAVEFSDSVSVDISAVTEILRQLSDYMQMQDGIQTRKDFNKTLADSMSMNDNVNLAKALLRTLLSNIEITDSIQAYLVAEIYRILSDNFEITDDNIEKTQEINQTHIDNLEFTDSVTLQLYLVRKLLESVDFSDRVIREVITVGLLNRVLLDGFSFTDTVNLETLLRIDRVLTDALEIQDALNRVTGYTRHLLDSFDLNDFASISITEAGLILQRLLADNFSLYDVLSRNVDVHRLIADTITLTDVIFRDASFVRLLQDHVEYADAIVQTTILRITRVLLESFNISDRVILQYFAFLEAFGYARMLLVYAKIDMVLMPAPITMQLVKISEIFMQLQDR